MAKIIEFLKSNKILLFIFLGFIILISIGLIIFGLYEVFVFFFGGSLIGAGASYNFYKQAKEKIDQEKEENEKNIIDSSYDDTSRDLDGIISERKGRKKRTGGKS